ncbi:MAG: dimethylsulfoniopropionate demethylase [Rhodospirillales bacterium]|nr:dimethylsulfoniopropionate demethylase [Rhodospirillales bacterium]
MSASLLSVSRRTRQTPFSNRVTEHGVKAYTVYNHMLLPAVFESLEADCRHLKTHVQVWDVACERQVEVRGPDAARLLQMLTPRNLGKMALGQCLYTPMVDETGGMLNDPLTLKLADDRYWISIADSDLLLWIKGLAYGLHLQVDVEEPDVSPLAIQGPKSNELVARVFGEAVRDIAFFRFAVLPFEGHDFIIARSGYSKQGGFEIYVDGGHLGEPLWDALFAAGKDLNVRAGGPNQIERIEAGLLSYGNDMTRENNPYECGLGKFCHTQSAIEFVGRDALLRVFEEGPVQQIRSLAIDGDSLPPCIMAWAVYANGKRVGQVTSATKSADFETNVAIGMIQLTHWQDGTRVEVETPVGMRTATVKENSFI